MRKISKIRALMLASTLLALSGCGNLNSVYRDFNVDDGSGAMVDIKQRAVIVSKQQRPLASGGTTERTLVCAEPSPDALSAYAAEAAAAADVPGQVTAQLAAASQESATFVGLRTQSIQLLRDALFRDCERYLNGAMSEADYSLAARRHQKFMVALLGIEQLTGAVRVPPVILTTQGQAEAGQSLSSLSDQLNAQNDEIDELKAQKKTPDENATDEEKKKIKDENDEIDKKIKQKEEIKDAIKEGIKNTRGVLVSGSAAGQTYNVSSNSVLSDASVEHVTSAVKDMVEMIFDRTDDTSQLCLAIVLKPDEVKAETVAFCRNWFVERAGDNNNHFTPNGNGIGVTRPIPRTARRLIYSTDLGGRSDLCSQDLTNPTSISLAIETYGSPDDKRRLGEVEQRVDKTVAYDELKRELEQRCSS